MKDRRDFVDGLVVSEFRRRSASPGCDDAFTEDLVRIRPYDRVEQVWIGNVTALTIRLHLRVDVHIDQEVGIIDLCLPRQDLDRIWRKLSALRDLNRDVFLDLRVVDGRSPACFTSL